MSIPISTISAKLITLLENAKDLAINHQQRTLASDAVRACGIYANSLKIGVSLETFKDLSAAVLDKQNAPLAEMFEDVQRKIVQADRASGKKTSAV